MSSIKTRLKKVYDDHTDTIWIGVGVLTIAVTAAVLARWDALFSAVQLAANTLNQELRFQGVKVEVHRANEFHGSASNPNVAYIASRIQTGKASKNTEILTDRSDPTKRFIARKAPYSIASPIALKDFILNLVKVQEALKCGTDESFLCDSRIAAVVSPVTVTVYLLSEAYSYTMEGFIENVTTFRELIKMVKTSYETLNKLHEKRIVHGNLSEENMMFVTQVTVEGTFRNSTDSQFKLGNFWNACLSDNNKIVCVNGSVPKSKENDVKEFTERWIRILEKAKTELPRTQEEKTRKLNDFKRRDEIDRGVVVPGAYRGEPFVPGRTWGAWALSIGDGMAKWAFADDPVVMRGKMDKLIGEMIKMTQDRSLTALKALGVLSRLG